MSLINRIEVSNFLNESRSKTWDPDFRLELLNFRAFSTIFLAPNGVGKTSLADAIFACLTMRQPFVKQTKERMSPAREKIMSHVRIEFMRPLAGDNPDQARQLDMAFKVRGEPWVAGICGHNDPDDMIHYFYQGVLEDAPVGYSENGRKFLYSDAEVEEAIAKIRGSKFKASRADWKAFIHNHISPRQLAMLEQFQKRGGGDNNPPLYEVKVKDDRYDRAFFYQHVVPQLMAGLHRPERDDDGAEDQEEMYFEQTLVISCRKLVQAKRDLERTKDKLDQIEAVYGDLEALVGKSDEIDQARAEYQKALAKVAEVGQAMEAVATAGVPGFPRNPSHSDEQVLGLLRHMDIKQGEGPVLRAAGMDVLLGLQAGRSARILSEPGVESVKISQPIEFVHDIIHAKSEVGPKTSRYLTEDQAMAFIEDLSAEVLKLSEDGAAARRKTLQSKIGIAFEHFRTRMDTSPQRRALLDVNRALEEMEVQLRASKKALEENERETSQVAGELRTLEDPRREWSLMRDSGLFNDQELEAPAATEERLSAQAQALLAEYTKLSETIGNISNTREALQKFRSEHGERSPLDVQAGLRTEAAVLAARLERLKAAIEDLACARKLGQADLTDVSRRCEALSKTLAELKVRHGSWETVQARFPGRTVSQVNEHLAERRGCLERELKRLGEAKEAPRTELKDSIQAVEAWSKATDFCFSQAVTEMEKRLAELEAVLPQVGTCEEFRARYGSQATPDQIIGGLTERRVKLQNRQTKLRADLARIQESLAMLESKQVAPGRVSAEALKLVPEGVKYRMLFEVIEAAGLEQNRKAEALATFSSLLFSPVVASEEGAQAVADIFEPKALPIPIFKEQGLERLLAEGGLADLGSAIHGHMSEMADILLHPERIAATKERYRRRERGFSKALEALGSAILKTRDNTPEFHFLKQARQAFVAEAEAKARELVGRVFAKLGPLAALLAGWSGMVANWPGVVPGGVQIGSDLDALANRLGVPVQPASPPAEVSAATIPAICESVRKFLQSDHRQAMERTLQSLQKKTASETARVDKIVARILQDVEAKEAELKAFDQEFSHGSFAQELALAAGYDPEAHRKAGAETAEAKKTKGEISEFLLAADGLHEDQGGLRNDLRDQQRKIEHALGAYAYKHLDDFIASGEGANAETLLAQRNTVAEQQKQVAGRLNFRFQDAQKYVGERTRDQELISRHEFLLYSRKQYEDHADGLSRQIDGHKDSARGLRELSLKYDVQLFEIQKHIKQFGLLLEDIEKVKLPQESQKIQEVRENLARLAELSGQGADQGLIEAISAIQGTIAGFEADSKAARAKTAKNAAEKAFESYGKACDDFLKGHPGLPEGLASDVRATRAEPSKMRVLYEVQRQVVNERRAEHQAQQETHQQMWDDQVSRLTEMSDEAKKAYAHLCRLCNRYKDEATFIFNAEVASPEVIEKLVEGIRDQVEVNEAQLQIEAERLHEDVKRIRKRKDRQLLEDVREQFYKAFFINPTIKYKHPFIANHQEMVFGGQGAGKVSAGQMSALQLLMAVRLAEFAKERDRIRHAHSKHRRRLQQAQEHSFLLLDGMLSNLSDEELIDESLKALESCRGVFQLIGFIHNRGYVNNYKIFPTFIVARRYSKDGTRSSASRWVVVEDIAEEDLPKLGFWQSAVAPGTPELAPLVTDEELLAEEAEG